MALSAKEVIASVRATLDYPSPGDLKMQILVLKLREKIDHYFNRLNLTDRDWFLDSTLITVPAGQDEVIISAPSFGRPISCETEDSTDSLHIRREIEIIDLQDRDLSYFGPKVAVGPIWNSKHSASSVAVFRTPAGVQTTKWTPAGQVNADYRIWFEPSRPLPLSLTGNIIFLEQFQNVLVVDLALTCLPYCNYESIVLSQSTNGKTRTKADGLRESLSRDLQMYLATFEEYAQHDKQNQIQIRPMWNSGTLSREEEFSW